MALTLGKRARDVDDEADDAKGKAAKKKHHKFLRGSRFVLFIGDEGAILLYIKLNNVISRQFVPDASEQNLQELKTSLDQDTKAPISIALDSMDQNYTQQTLPPVSSMSVKKLIDRRLQRDFAPTDIKGAILLGREKKGRKDWNFLMVSIERSRQVLIWLDFVQGLPNRFQGIYLVSVETEIVIRKLEESMRLESGVKKVKIKKKTQKEERVTPTPTNWKFFVSHNKVGGFRQVVLRDGRIIFTRMSQPIGESTPEVIAGNIEQEMQSTIEYMKRLTFNVQTGLDVYIIASAAIKPLIDKNKIVSNSFNVLTPYEVAQYLGIEGATQPSDQFGDVILAASIATSTQHVLTLTTPESKRYDKLYNIFRAQRMMSALMVLGVLGYAGSIASDIYLKYLDSEDLEQAKHVHQRNLNDLHDEIKASNLDVDHTGDLMDQYQLLLKQTKLPFGFINKVQQTLKSPIVIKSFDWSVDDKTAIGNALLPPKMVVTILLQFPGVNDAETFKALSKKLLEDLKLQFKTFDIAFSKLPAKYTETDNLNVNFDSAAAQAAAANKEAPDVTLTFKEQ